MVTDPPAVTLEQFEREQAERVRGHQARIWKDLSMMRPRDQLVCRGSRTRVVREDGTEYESVSDAARCNNVNKVDNICQAIRRGGKCSGWRWRYKEYASRDEKIIEMAVRYLKQSDQPRGRNIAGEVLRGLNPEMAETEIVSRLRDRLRRKLEHDAAGGILR
jgi:hypothetical protein